MYFPMIYCYICFVIVLLVIDVFEDSDVGENGDLRLSQPGTIFAYNY